MSEAPAGSISFRPLSSGDAFLVHELHGDPLTNTHNPVGASPNPRASGELLESWLQHQADHGFGYELAFDDDRLVGICGARRDRWREIPVINLYWRLLPAYWGRGLAGNLGQRALDIARSASPLDDELIVARMLPANVASAHVAEALGLTRRDELDGDANGAHWIVYASTVPVP